MPCACDSVFLRLRHEHELGDPRAPARDRAFAAHGRCYGRCSRHFHALFPLQCEQAFADARGGFACVALSEVWELSSLLTCMMLGCVFANMRRDSVRVLEIIDGWTPALFMLFFVFSGAELDFSILTTVGVIGIVYILARSIGKYTGSWLGAAISKSDKNVKKYLGITLLPQAGVAIGMAQMVAATPELPAELASQVVTVALFATLVYELVGPVLTKLALKKAGEIDESNLGKRSPIKNIARLFKRSAAAK
ncbi:MAG: cation:proton antiporter [Clostridia bacterium]|nr:cation:proton antiporter [Clostridia bacterium]